MLSSLTPLVTWWNIMDQERMLGIQQQLRQNQTELHDFLSDLSGWEKNIKDKDEDLKKSSQGETTLPPVRNSLLKKKRKKKKSQIPGNTPRQKPARLSGYDYSAWDKYIAETEAQDEKEEKLGEISEEDDGDTDEEWEQERKIQQAVLFKDQGNQSFKEGNFGMAIEYYTRGISCDPSNCAIIANRAMAFLKQNMYAAAELDCSAAISLDHTYVKAFQRRGTARVGLKRWAEACEDFHRVLQIEPHNKQTKKDLDIAKKALELEESPLQTNTDSGVVKAITKPPHARSKCPLRRMVIQEVGGECKVKEYGLQRIEIQNETVEDNTEIKQSKTLDDNSSTSMISDDTETHTVMRENNKAAKTNTSVSHPGQIGSHLNSRIAETVMNIAPSDDLPPPKTACQFQADYRHLRKHPAALVKYLQAIPASDYPRLLLSTLDTDNLLVICTALLEESIPAEDISKILHSLTTVPRFSMAVMFLSSSNKRVLKQLIERLDNSVDKDTADQASKIRKLYEL